MRIFLLVLLCCSCAKTSYLIEQGVGQVALEWNGRDNSEVLADPKVSKKDKNKIKLIQQAKKYFYDYFKMDSTGIYDETTFLKNEAVTYLVIASKVEKVEAIKVEFPIMGSFPYLGFFSEESAKEYKSEQDKKGFSTYMRKVYAYSTLNQWMFDDNILSSFFLLDDEQLVELIFHELVHTVIFVKNDVPFNENLAQFISQRLLEEFFHYDMIRKEQIQKDKLKNSELLALIVEQVKELNALYAQNKNYQQTLNTFLKDNFIPAVQAKCSELALIQCWPLKEPWNNARFAALGTYVAKQDRILDLFKGSKKNLKEFFHWIIKKYDKFEGNKKFLDYLES